MLNSKRIKPQFWVAWLVGKILGAAGRTERSTIEDAELLGFQNRVLLANLKSMPPAQLESIISTLEGVPEKSRNRAMEIDGVKIFTIGDILEVAKEVAGNRVSSTGRGPKETFNLEEGHKPDLWENLHSIETAAMITVIVVYYALSGFIAPETAPMVGHAVQLYAAYGISGLAFTGRFQTNKWFQRLFPLALAKISARNATMARNIDRIFSDREDIGLLLAMQGKAHFPGTKILLEANGWQPVSLPSPAQMEMQNSLE